MGQGSKNKTVFKLPVEITLVIWRVSQYVMHFLLHSTARYGCIVCIASGKIPGRERAFHHPAFMGICPTLVTSVSPIYLIDEIHILFLLFLPYPPQIHTAASEMASFSVYGVL